MLVLTRKNGESIVINHQITVTVVRLSGNRVRLGIEAPEEVSIKRGEIQAPLTGTPVPEPHVGGLHECAMAR